VAAKRVAGISSERQASCYKKLRCKWCSSTAIIRSNTIFKLRNWFMKLLGRQKTYHDAQYPSNIRLNISRFERPVSEFFIFWYLSEQLEWPSIIITSQWLIHFFQFQYDLTCIKNYFHVRIFKQLNITKRITKKRKKSNIFLRISYRRLNSKQNYDCIQYPFIYFIPMARRWPF